MNPKTYKGEWSSWDDVCRDFNINEPEPDAVLAAYETPPYEGYATVLFVRDGVLMEVHGSHCSCYGLEDQWDPSPAAGVVALVEAAGRVFHYAGLKKGEVAAWLEAVDRSGT